MLKLRKGNPPTIVLALAGGASVRVRPATSTDVMFAVKQIEKLRAVDDPSVLSNIAGLLGVADLTAEKLAGDDLRETVFQRLATIHLAALCIEGWDGVEFEGSATPNVDAVAALLRDPDSLARVRDVLNAPVFETV